MKSSIYTKMSISRRIGFWLQSIVMLIDALIAIGSLGFLCTRWAIEFAIFRTKLNQD